MPSISCAAAAGRQEPVHPDHVAYYSQSTLAHLVKRAGLDVTFAAFYDVGREHRPYMPAYWRIVSDVLVGPRAPDGRRGHCRVPARGGTERQVKVGFVIPVHNRRETTLRALGTLTRIDRRGLDLRVFVVDDGSCDGTSDAVRAAFPDVQILQGDGTLHYAAGTNMGLRAALDWGARHVVAANDDSIFHADSLQRLVATAEATPRAVVGALLLRWDQPHRVFQVAPQWDLWYGGWRLPESLTAFSVPDRPFDVELVVGNCVLIPAEAMRAHGLLDAANFRHGWGDAQFTMRLRRAGWRLVVDPRARVWCEPNTNPPPLATLTAGELAASCS
jgi:GT2 family glycosyltransferase